MKITASPELVLAFTLAQFLAFIALLLMAAAGLVLLLKAPTWLDLTRGALVMLFAGIALHFVVADVDIEFTEPTP